MLDSFASQLEPHDDECLFSSTWCLVKADSLLGWHGGQKWSHKGRLNNKTEIQLGKPLIVSKVIQDPPVQGTHWSRVLRWVRCPRRTHTDAHLLNWNCYINRAALNWSLNSAANGFLCQCWPPPKRAGHFFKARGWEPIWDLFSVHAKNRMAHQGTSSLKFWDPFCTSAPFWTVRETKFGWTVEYHALHTTV